jgi:pimeloyl-ACP methyl ester carboxylesterase
MNATDIKKVASRSIFIMNESDTQLADAWKMPAEVAKVFAEKMQRAKETLNERILKAQEGYKKALSTQPIAPWNLWQIGYEYTVDLAQRSILFWDTLRQRGNNFIEHERAGEPPVLHFDYEMLMDARKFERPVNYAIVKIIPPPGVTVGPKRRPYIIIDPRAGHGPGVGGFKDDSEVGVALRDGHPVYFVMFFPMPEPGQTILDVCAAEERFVRKVRELHPDSPKPVIVGNCQGGWAAMMLAAQNPELIGPVVINGAPMSYWSGATEPGQVSSPIRYEGGLLGGSWLASFVADAGNGIFDGANLVENFEYQNPANSLWDKYYHLFANVDTESPRFLDFERWWGGFYLVNRQEIDWILQQLFVGNKVWSQEKPSGGKLFDLRRIQTPIILFASMGDNLTTPQEAFNWVADVYGSTEEIKARGQTIIGLLQGHVGHLGIFVSGEVAKKEHASIVSVLKYVEALRPGLYAMKINTLPKDESGKVRYEIEFEEHRLEDIVQRINRFGRRDERPFQAVAALSEFNQRLYEAFLQPIVQRMSSDFTAKLARFFHPLRVQHWALSDMNPWLAWLGGAAGSVKANRHAADSEQPLRQMEQAMSDLISASLDYYRDVRDAVSAAAFFLMYGNIFSMQLAKQSDAASVPTPEPFPIEDVLRSITEGGYAAAVARAAFLLHWKEVPLPLERVELVEEILEEYADLLPRETPRERQLNVGRQEIICRHEPEKALKTLPILLSEPTDRDRFLTLMDKLLADPRVNESITPEQAKMAKRIRNLCETEVSALAV